MGSVAIVLSAIATPSQIMRECLEAFSCAIRRHASTCPFRMCPLDISGPFSSALLSVLMLMRCVTPGCTEGASPLFCYASAPRDTASRYARNTECRRTDVQALTHSRMDACQLEMRRALIS
mmetsp:Transcript_42346/g.112186  ORF Transcript_42346/g.112186 Transcript_42346/m.112186 type:complete len:121 (-) Transcript_42346:154-516(-)